MLITGLGMAIVLRNSKKMNKIKRGPVPSGVFNIVMRYIFEDPETVEEDYLKHDELRVKQVAHIAFADLHSLHSRLIGEDVGVLEGIKLSELEGHWMLEGTRSDNNGMYWDEVTEIVKCHEVEEVITVTKWKPIEDETQSSEESIPARPVGKK